MYERVTFTGYDDLFRHPQYGARTLSDIKEIDERRRKIREQAKKQPIQPQTAYHYDNDISEELSIANERCIDKYGCNMF